MSERFPTSTRRKLSNVRLALFFARVWVGLLALHVVGRSAPLDAGGRGQGPCHSHISARSLAVTNSQKHKEFLLLMNETCTYIYIYYL